MNHFDSEYDLEDDDRAILAKKLQNLDDAGFESFKGEFSVFAKAKKKCAKKSAPVGDPEKEEMDEESCSKKKEAKASEALKEVDPKKEDKPLNAVKAEEKEKDYKEAFSLEKGFTLNFQKR